MDNFTAFNYQNLPKPEILEEISAEALFEENLKFFQQRFPEFEDVLDSDPMIAMLKTFAAKEAWYRRRMNWNASQAYLMFAQGSNLDLAASEFHAKRQVAQYMDSENNMEEILEDDETFRRRALLALEAITTAGSEGAYLFHIFTAGSEPTKINITADEPGKVIMEYNFPKNGFAARVRHAKVITPAPGVVAWSFMGRSDDGQPDNETKEAIEKQLNTGDVAPLTDAKQYVAAQIKHFSADIKVYLDGGAVAEIVKEKAEKAWLEYLDSICYLGAIVDDAGIARAFKRDGVLDVDIEGFSDVECQWFEYPMPENVNIKFILRQHNPRPWENNWIGGSDE